MPQQVEDRAGSAWASRAFIACGVGAPAVYFMLPKGSLTRAYLHMAIHVASIVALTVGTRINRPSRPAVWNVLLVSQGFYFCGHMLWYFLPVLRETTLPFSSWSDPFFIVAHPRILATPPPLPP